MRSCSLPVSRPKTRSQTQAHNILVSEPGFDMVDQRLECLEKEMIELSQYQPTLIYGGKNCQKSGGDGGYSSQPISEFSFGCRPGRSKNHGAKTYASRTGSRFVAPKLAKLDFPWYDGSEDPTSWVWGAIFQLPKYLRGRKISIDSLSSRRRSPIMVPAIQGERGRTNVGGHERRLTHSLWADAVREFLW
jgi:hypothetical protein